MAGCERERNDGLAPRPNSPGPETRASRAAVRAAKFAGSKASVLKYHYIWRDYLRDLRVYND